MALVGDIQLQDSAVKPPALDTSLRFSAEGLTATTAFAVTDAGAGNTVTPLGLFTAQSANDISAYFNTTNTDGDVNLYLNNDANPYWNVKLSATAGAADSFMIANACGTNATAEYPAFSIAPAGAVGIGKTGASNILDITYANATTGGMVLTESTNSVATKVISLATCSVMGTSTNHKLGFITNNTTVGMFDTSGNLGIGTEAPGALLDVRGSAIFNEAGAAVDFRVEGDTEANLFIVDGSTDRIGIGTATPAVELDLDFGGDGTGVLMCVNGCICAVGYLGEKQGHTIEDSGTAETQRTGLNFVVTDVGCVVDDSANDATVVCINGANTCVPFLLCDGSTSDPISLVGGSIGNQLANDSNPTLGGLMCGGGNNICAVCCICITGCYFGDGSQLTGVSSVPSSFSGDCTIIGCSAGGNVAAGGAKIVLIGGNAGYNATTPSNIVVMGSSAALCMTTATDTVLIGTGSGRCVLTCAGNLALGAWSLYNECAGSFNTALGTCAGLTQKGATTNTFVGAYAGTAVTTGSGNVFIGHKAGCGETTGSCCLIIGNGTGSCDLITGDFNGGSLLIAGSLVTCGALTVGVNDTGHDVKFFGASSGAFMLYDESADTLEVRGPSADATTSTGKLKLTTALTDINDNDVLGRIDFAAPLEAGGTDAILAGGAIWGEAEATFSSSVNSTALVFGTNTSAAATERMRIDSSGNVGIGTATPSASLDICTTNGNFSVNDYGVICAQRRDASAAGGQMYMIKTRSGSTITTGDTLGAILWYGHDGTDTAQSGAGITVTTEGTIGSNRIPASMCFSTAPDVASCSAQVRMMIGADGDIGIGTTVPGGGYQIHQYTASGNNYHYIQTAGTNGKATLLVGNDAQAYYYGVGDDDKLHWGAGTDPSYACMTMDSSGNFGIGVTPHGTHADWVSISLGSTASIYTQTASAAGKQLRIGQNVHLDTDGSDEYIVTDEASNYAQIDGTHTWYTAASGTAGNDISWGTAKMVIDNGGIVGVGTASPGTYTNDRIGLVVADTSGSADIGIVSGTSGAGYLSFSDTADATHQGYLLYDHSVNMLASNAVSYQSLRTGGTERIRIDSSGNVGIGAASPASILQVCTTNGDIALNDYAIECIHRSSADGGSPQLCFIGSRGGGVITSGDGLGQINFAGADGSDFKQVGGYIAMYSTGTIATNRIPGCMQFATAPDLASCSAQVRMTITADGIVCTPTLRLSNCGLLFTGGASNEFPVHICNTTTGNAYGMKMHLTAVAPDNNAYSFLDARDCVAVRTIIYTDGDVWTADAGTLTSDNRLKTNIVDASDKLADIMKLKVRNFEWIPEYHPAKVGEKKIGFIAQELETVFPSLIHEHDIDPGNGIDEQLYTAEDIIPDGKAVGDVKVAAKAHEPVIRKSYKNAFVPILVKALQEVATRLETAEAKIATIEAA